MKKIITILLATLVSSIIAKPKVEIKEFKIPFYPNEVGHYKGKAGNNYFAVSKRRLMLLDSNLKLIKRELINRDVSAFDFGDINNDGMQDLLLLSQDFIFVRLQNEDGTFGERKITVKNKFFAPYFPKDITQFKLGTDLDNDGDFDLVLPGIGQIFHYENNFSQSKSIELKESDEKSESIWTLKVTLPTRHVSTFSSEVFRYTGIKSDYTKSTTLMPHISYHDFNNDGMIDIYMRTGKIFYFFMSDKPESQIMSKNPNLKKNKKEFFVKRKVRVYPVSLANNFVTNAQMVDLNNDGKLDLMLSVVRSNGIVFNNSIYIYWTKKNIPAVRKKTKYIQKGGFISPMQFKAKNKNFFLTPSVDIGVSTAMSYLLGKSITTTMNFLEIKGKKVKEKNNFNISLSLKNGLIPGFATGDFNGDGYTDLAMGYDKKESYIYSGNDYMSKEVFANLKVAGTASFKAVPSFKSKKSELLVFYPYYVKDLDRKKILLIKFK